MIESWKPLMARLRVQRREYCPAPVLTVLLALTAIWEQQLRRIAGQQTHDRSFIDYWLSELLYVEAPWWAFAAAYTGFVNGDTPDDLDDFELDQPRIRSITAWQWIIDAVSNAN